MSLSREERERWIEALSSRLQRRVEILVDINTNPEIKSEVDAMPNQEKPESTHHRDNPHISSPAAPPTEQGIEEKP